MYVRMYLGTDERCDKMKNSDWTVGVGVTDDLRVTSQKVVGTSDLIVEYVGTFWDWKRFEIAMFKNDEVTCFFSKQNSTWLDVVPNELADDYRLFLKTGKVFKKQYKMKQGKFEWFQHESIDNVEFKDKLFWYDSIKMARQEDTLLRLKVTEFDNGQKAYEIPSTGKIILSKAEHKEVDTTGMEIIDIVTERK